MLQSGFVSNLIQIRLERIWISSSRHYCVHNSGYLNFASSLNVPRNPIETSSLRVCTDLSTLFVVWPNRARISTYSYSLCCPPKCDNIINAMTFWVCARAKLNGTGGSKYLACIRHFKLFSQPSSASYLLQMDILSSVTSLSCYV